MTGKPQERSLTSEMIKLFEDGGKYTTNELTEQLHLTRPSYRFDYLKRQVEQIRAGLKKGTRVRSIDPLNLQKLEDNDGIKRWRLIND